MPLWSPLPASITSTLTFYFWFLFELLIHLQSSTTFIDKTPASHLLLGYWPYSVFHLCLNVISKSLFPEKHYVDRPLLALSLYLSLFSFFPLFLSSVKIILYPWIPSFNIIPDPLALGCHPSTKSLIKYLSGTGNRMKYQPFSILTGNHW